MTSPIIDQPTLDRARAALTDLRQEVAKAVVGQDSVVTGLVIALLCRGHVLLEGVPGVAKTLLVRALAAALDARDQAGPVHSRPDARRHHRLAGLRRPNRRSSPSGGARSSPTCSSPTRSTEPRRRPRPSLLEAMEERQVSVDGVPRPLPDPFVVAATQNPVEYEGTYPLPEAQLDRFLLKLAVPSRTGTTRSRSSSDMPRDSTRANLAAAGLSRVAGPADLAAGRAAVRHRSGRRPRSSGTSSTSAGPPDRRHHSSWASLPAARPRCWRRAGRGHGCRGVIS